MSYYDAKKNFKENRGIINPTQDPVLFNILKFNLKRNIFFRSKVPHLVSDSLNISLVYY